MEEELHLPLGLELLAEVVVVRHRPEGGHIVRVHELLAVEVQGLALAVPRPLEQLLKVPGHLDAPGQVLFQVHHIDALVVVGDHVDEVQLLLRLHQLLGLEEEGVLLLLQPALLLQLAHLLLGDLADEDVAHGLVAHRVPEAEELRRVPLIAQGLVALHPVLLHRGLAAGQEVRQQGGAAHEEAVLLPVLGVDGGQDDLLEDGAVGLDLHHRGKEGLVGRLPPQQAEGVVLQGDLQAGDGVVGHPVQEFGGLLPAVALLHLLGHVPDGADGGGHLVVRQGVDAQLDPGLLGVHGAQLHLAALAQDGLLQGGLEGRLPLGGAVEVGQQPPGGVQGGFLLAPGGGGDHPDHPAGQQLEQPHVPLGDGGADQGVSPGLLLGHFVPVHAVADLPIQQHRHGGQGIDEDEEVVLHLELKDHRRGHEGDP